MEDLKQTHRLKLQEENRIDKGNNMHTEKKKKNSNTSSSILNKFKQTQFKNL